MTSRDLVLARKAKKAGANYALRIVIEARRAGIPVSLGFALIEQESNFKNVYGHDPVRSRVGGPVTKSNYAIYKARRKAGLGMQGVGPAQLTWWEFQDQADRLGGCWIPRHNIRVAFSRLAALIDERGLVFGLQRYNGIGPAAVVYSKSVRIRFERWRKVLA